MPSELTDSVTSVMRDLDYRILKSTENTLLFDNSLSNKRSEFTGKGQLFKRIDEGKLEIIANPDDTTLRLSYSVSCTSDLLFLMLPIIIAITMDYRAILGVGLFMAQSMLRLAFIKGSSRMMLIEIVKKETGEPGPGFSNP